MRFTAFGLDFHQPAAQSPRPHPQACRCRHQGCGWVQEPNRSTEPDVADDLQLPPRHRSRTAPSLDHSRHVICWTLYGNLQTRDGTAALDIALAGPGCDSAKVLFSPRLLGGNGSSIVAARSAEPRADKGMKRVRGAPMPPRTRGKSGRWHQTLKDRIRLENDFFEGEFEVAIAAFVDHCNHHRYHKSIGKLTSASAHLGHLETIMAEGKSIRYQTI